MARRCISNAFSPSPEKDVEFPGPANDVGVIRIELQGALEVIGRAVELVRNKTQGARDPVALGPNAPSFTTSRSLAVDETTAPAPRGKLTRP